MGRDRAGICLHFPEPRLIFHDCPSHARYCSRISYNKPRRDRSDSLRIRTGIRHVATILIPLTTSSLIRSEIPSVWAALVRPPIRNLREGTSVTDYERRIPRWVERENILPGTRTHSRSAFNLGCGFAQNKAQLTVLRFMAGLGGGAPLAVRIPSPNSLSMTSDSDS